MAENKNVETNPATQTHEDDTARTISKRERDGSSQEAGRNTQGGPSAGFDAKKVKEQPGSDREFFADK